MGYSPRVAKSQTRLSDFTFTFMHLQQGTAGPVGLFQRCACVNLGERSSEIVPFDVYSGTILLFTAQQADFPYSFQSERRGMPKNVQTAAQLHSFHLLAK